MNDSNDNRSPALVPGDMLEKEFQRHIEDYAETRKTLFEVKDDSALDLCALMKGDQVNIDGYSEALANADAEIRWWADNLRLLRQCRSKLSIAVEMATGEQVESDECRDRRVEVMHHMEAIKGLFDILHYYGDTQIDGTTRELSADAFYGLGKAGLAAEQEVQECISQLLD